jgi:exopolysaccharide biosynthesis polyprenyl glycosylphosphotransferase
MGVFILMMAQENQAIIKFSRTMGITFSTYIIVGLLFINIYGKYDVGRKKSKPIVYALSLAVVFTDIITYVQLMMMNTIEPSIRAFRLSSLGTLFLAMVIQIVIIIIFAYAGNALFFKIHAPEKCHIVTSSQQRLDEIVRGILKYKKQYSIEAVHDYRHPDLLHLIKPADTVFLYDVPPQERSEVVSYCYKKRKNIYFNPEIEDIVEMSSQYYLLDDISVLNYNVKGLTMEQRIIKRCMDIILALFMIICSSPIWIVSALAIKLYDGGSIFFKQNRATINGKVFQVYKFRTMKENVENRSVTDGDDRITKPGKILRKIRMDELPQLLNILKGDMSFVGPRPEMMENVESYTEELPEFAYRLRVKAGLTGYAQIAGKYNTTPKDKLMMDLMYIEHYSILKDIQLLFQTAIVLLKSDSTEAFNKGKELEQYKFESYEEK